MAIKSNGGLSICVAMFMRPYECIITCHNGFHRFEGNLHVLIKKIPSFSIEGSADLKLNDSEKKMAEKISVTFHGDYELENNPTTYLEAIETYRTLPQLLKKDNYGVPVKVWLYPLSLLNDKAAKLAREISNSLVSKTEQLLEELGEVERRW